MLGSLNLRQKTIQMDIEPSTPLGFDSLQDVCLKIGAIGSVGQDKFHHISSTYISLCHVVPFEGGISDLT